MAEIGKIISEKRQLKGLTQEDLAEGAKVNLRTVQRIEAGETTARAKTLSLISEVLQIDLEDLISLNSRKDSKYWTNLIVKVFFVVVINIILITVFGYLTMDSKANTNSRLASLLLSFFIPFFIVYQTKAWDGLKRLLHFGGGLLAYLVLFAFIVKFPVLTTSGLLPLSIIFWFVLFYGNHFIKEK